MSGAEIPEFQRIEQFAINAKIELQSGTRVGGSDDLLGIGTVDLTCIKNPVTRQPYLPGSSLKGKMRSELEKQMGRFGGEDSSQPCGCGKCVICRVFGPHFNLKHSLGPSRLIVRDALLLSGGEIETKTENIIDRKRGTALHPRQVERVVPGSVFSFQVVVNVLEMDRACKYEGATGGAALYKLVRHGMYLLEETGVGSGTSKGYGRIKFVDVQPRRNFSLEQKDKDGRTIVPAKPLPSFEDEINGL
jgi:CRISPR-associated protein Csm3